jgi:hypothetical protein
MLADHPKTKKSAVTAKGLRLPRKNPFEPLGLSANFRWGHLIGLGKVSPSSANNLPEGAPKTAGTSVSSSSRLLSAPVFGCLVLRA